MRIYFCPPKLLLFHFPPCSPPCTDSPQRPQNRNSPHVNSNIKNLGDFSSKKSIIRDTFFILVILVITHWNLPCSKHSPPNPFFMGQGLEHSNFITEYLSPGPQLLWDSATAHGLKGQRQWPLLLLLQATFCCENKKQTRKIKFSGINQWKLISR